MGADALCLNDIGTSGAVTSADISRVDDETPMRRDQMPIDVVVIRRDDNSVVGSKHF